MAREISILSVGKTKEKWLQDALELYIKRLTSTVKITFISVKDDQALCKQIDGYKGILLLDPIGKSYTSPSFADMFHKHFEQNAGEVCFVIGGPEGLPEEIKSRYPAVSLSPLTLTHQMVRLLIIEQIYRSFELAKGSSYHK